MTPGPPNGGSHPEKEVAIALGVSLSTVESDLRHEYAVLLDVKKRLEFEWPRWRSRGLPRPQHGCRLFS